MNSLVQSTTAALIPMLMLVGCSGLSSQPPVASESVVAKADLEQRDLEETRTPLPAETAPLPFDSLPSPQNRSIAPEPPVTDAASSPYGADPLQDPKALDGASTAPLELPADTSIAMIPQESAPAPRPPVSKAIYRGFTLEAPPAVSSLEKEIDTKMTARNYADAATILERAIRIQPKNPELWHVLALARLKQNQPAQAEDLAKKSNLLAKNNADLVKLNWQVMAEARRQLGNYEGSIEAANKGL